MEQISFATKEKTLAGRIQVGLEENLDMLLFASDLSSEIIQYGNFDSI